jgi:hypothetical protein
VSERVRNLRNHTTISKEGFGSAFAKKRKRGKGSSPI